MLLKSSLIIFLLANIFFENIKILGVIFLLIVVLNIIFNKNIFNHLKRIKILILFYVSTFFIQLYYNQQGRVLYRFYKFYITQEGLINFSTNFIRIINFILLSWLLNEMKIFKGRLSKYQKIVEIVIELVPQVFVLVKKKMNLKFFYRHILKKIKIEYEKGT